MPKAKMTRTPNLVERLEPKQRNRKIPKGYVVCITDNGAYRCGKVIPEKEARSYGSGPVCPDCYDAWFKSND